MNKEYLHIILADDNKENQAAFRNVFKELKINIKIQSFDSENDLLNYMEGEENLIPEILFMNYEISGERNIQLLEKIKSFQFSNMVIAVYSNHFSDDEAEEIFINGGNICITLPVEDKAFKKVLSDVITTNWQYYTSGFNKDNFIMKM